jgi:integrase
MGKNIAELVAGVLHELEVYGLTRSTIRQYQRGFYQPIIKFFNSTNFGNYSTEAFESCMKNYENSYLSGEIKRHHYQSMKRSLEYVRHYALSGKVDFTRKVDTKIYKPNAKALKIIECALAATTLKEKFKYRLNACMRSFFCFIESKDMHPEDIFEDIIKKFLVHVAKSNQGSMDYVIYSLKVLFSYFQAAGIVDIKMKLEYFVPKAPPQKIIPAFTMDEIGRILKKIDCSISSGKRDKAIILLACMTGFRGIDIVNLKLEDIDWKTGEISIIQSKTEHPVKLPVNGQVLNAVADYILNARPESMSRNVFLRTNAPFTALKGTAALDGILDNLCMKAGVEKKNYRSFHSLRRSFATWMASAEVSITTISQMLGHKGMDSDRPYLSFNRNQMVMCSMGFEDIPMNGGIYA